MPSSRVRGTTANATITAATMDKVEEAHLDAVLCGLQPTQFNQYALKELSPQDKIAACPGTNGSSVAGAVASHVLDVS